MNQEKKEALIKQFLFPNGRETHRTPTKQVVHVSQIILTKVDCENDPIYDEDYCWLRVCVNTLTQEVRGFWNDSIPLGVTPRQAMGDGTEVYAVQTYREMHRGPLVPSY